MSRSFLVLAVVALVGAVTTVGAQDPNYVLSLGVTSGAPGGSVSLVATLDNNGGDIAGWSYGVCNDSSILTPVQVNEEDTAFVKNGAAADFNETALLAGGWSQGVVICFTVCAVVPGGTTGFAMASADYQIDPGAPPGNTTVSYCSTLGSPPVSTVVVTGGASIAPTTIIGTVEVVPCLDAAFEFVAPVVGPLNFPTPTGLGGINFSVSFQIADLTGMQPGLDCPSPYLTQGFSMGCSHDGALFEPTSVVSALPFTPDFAESGIFSDGWTVGIVYSFDTQTTMDFVTPSNAVTVDYSGIAGALSGVEDDVNTPLTWDSGLGIPPVSNVVVADGASHSANFVNGSITFTGGISNSFIGGDCNADSLANIADVIWLLSLLFNGGPSSGCPIACDTNGDGFLDVGDAIYIASYIFLGGPEPFGFPCDTVPGQTPEDCTVVTCAP